MESLVKALKVDYSLDALRSMRKEALEKLRAGEYMISANTSGVSFARGERIKTREWVDALQQAIESLEGADDGFCGQVTSFVVRY